MATHEEMIAAWQSHGTISGAAREVGLARSTIREFLIREGFYNLDNPIFKGKVSALTTETRALPKGKDVKRYLLTSMQNNTMLFDKVWDSLLLLKEHYSAELLVGTFTYDKSSYGRKSVKLGSGPSLQDTEALWYDLRAKPFISDDQIEIAPGLVWCGEMNILPTAARPLSDLQVYTARKSGIFPHVKMAMDSIPSTKYEPTKFNYTTGTITRRNYIQKKAGLKAEFHHVYGALLVEVDSQGNWFVRQINSDEKGVIYDLDLKVDNGEITEGNRVKAIVWGDLHETTLEPDIRKLAWGPNGMLNQLKPEYQFMHDVIDFRARNVHTAKKNLIHDRFLAYVQGHDSVEEEIEDVAAFLIDTSRDWCRTVVVDSNHDRFIIEWLRIGDYRNDPVNAIYFLALQLYVYTAIREEGAIPNLLEWAINRFEIKTEIEFLGEDESFVVGGIENGMHGDRGPNGARGTPRNHARMGRRMNRGHEHSASIHDGVFTSGIMGNLDQGYNRGPSSWSHSNIVQYQNGKRAIYTIFGNKWRA